MRISLVFILTLIFALTSFSQESRQFNRELWEKEAESLEYLEYDEQEEYEEEEEQESSEDLDGDSYEEEKPRERKRKRSDSSTSSGSGMNIILYIIVGAILVALIVMLISQYKGDPEIKNQNIVIDDDLDLETVQKSELELKIEEALAAGDYRLAVRIYFLVIIKSLSTKELINWQKRKTNHSYLNELGDKGLKSQFGTTIKLFEVVWYGRTEISEEDYRSVEPVFKDFIRVIEDGR